MTKIFKVELNGINWYAVGNKALTVNATYDDVNIDNYNEVSDIDCFTMQKPVQSTEELENEVFEFVGNSRLHDDVWNAIDIASDEFDVYSIVRKIESQACYRENRILAKFDSIEIDGNLLHIYSTERTGFSVGYCKERLGDIVA